MGNHVVMIPIFCGTINCINIFSSVWNVMKNKSLINLHLDYLLKGTGFHVSEHLFNCSRFKNKFNATSFNIIGKDLFQA